MARLYTGAMDAADNAEKRLLALLRSQVPSANRAGRGTDTFVQEQNIAHYRALLQAAERSSTWSSCRKSSELIGPK